LILLETLAVKWYARNIGDYQTATAMLTLIEHGAYTVLLDYYYATNGNLPTSLDDLARICRARTEGEIAALQKVLDMFFERSPNGDGYRHARADEEIAKARQISERRAKSGRMRATSVRAKARQVLSNVEANAEQILSNSSENSEPVDKSVDNSVKSLIENDNSGATAGGEAVDDSEQLLSKCSANAEQVLSNSSANAQQMTTQPTTTTTTTYKTYPGLRPGLSSDKSLDDVHLREKKPKTKKQNTLFSEASANDEPVDKSVDNSVKALRDKAKIVAQRVLEYLNARCGTRFATSGKAAEAHMNYLIARIINDGATEEQLLSVVNAKVEEWGADEKMRKFLRPATLFNRTNYANYVGQLAATPPPSATEQTEAEPPLVRVLRANEAGVERVVTEYRSSAKVPPEKFPYLEAAKKCLERFRSYIVNGHARTLIVEYGGTRRVFGVAELSENQP
jgi:uncharacterized phage protein (TIGR02220 family)